MKGVELIEVKKNKSETYYNVFLNGKDSGFRGMERYENKVTKRYPFIVKNGKVLPKYKSIKCISTTGGKRPSSGFSISYFSGFGFTNPKGVNNLFIFFQEIFPNVQEIIFLKIGETKIEGNKFFLLLEDFQKLQSQSESFLKAKKRDARVLYYEILSKLLPKQSLSIPKRIYTPGSLTNYINSFRKLNLSEDDKEVIKEIFLNSNLSTQTILSARQELEIIYIEDVIIEYKDLLKLVSNTKGLEDKWHQFFKKHTWIFSNLFSFPAVYLKDKFNVGGQNIDGDTDKVVDFIYKNTVTNNIAFVEIKTHLSPLVNSSEYRKPNIFSISSELSGAIVQVLDQKHKLLNNFHSRIGASANSLNSICVIIAGSISELNKTGQRESFELFRWSNKDVIVIPFDELLSKLENLLKLFKRDKT